MFNIITLVNKRRQTHITRGATKGRIPRSTFCGCRFKLKHIKSIDKGNIEMCTCQKCINVINSNPGLYSK